MNRGVFVQQTEVNVTKRDIKRGYKTLVELSFVQSRVDESQMSERTKNTHSPQYISSLFAISQCAVHHAAMCQGSV